MKVGGEDSQNLKKKEIIRPTILASFWIISSLLARLRKYRQFGRLHPALINGLNPSYDFFSAKFIVLKTHKTPVIGYVMSINMKITSNVNTQCLY